MNASVVRVYFTSMAAYWVVFGLITAFYPGLMDLFQTAGGVMAKTSFSNHVWFHGGFDIFAFCVLLFFLARENVSARMLRAAGLAALMPTFAIGYSYFATPYWTSLFLVAGAGCLAFVIWGFVLATNVERGAREGSGSLAVEEQRAT